MEHATNPVMLLIVVFGHTSQDKVKYTMVVVMKLSITVHDHIIIINTLVVRGFIILIKQHVYIIHGFIMAIIQALRDTVHLFRLISFRRR